MVFDWLICGSGVTGAALGYELQRSGFRCAIIDRSPLPPNATRFSYGGIPYWSGTTDATKTLCQESIGRYPSLGDELGDDIGFREIKLLLTVSPDDDRESLASSYPAQWQDNKTIGDLEPLLNLDAIDGAFVLDHAQVDPESLVRAYLGAFTRSGGTLIYEEIVELLERGVRTKNETIGGNGVIVCAGGAGRRLLRGYGVPLFFTHGELVEIDPTETRLQTFVLPASLKRLDFEARGAFADSAWLEDQPEILPPSFDWGGVPLRDGRMRLGQVSRLHPNPDFVPLPTSEALIRGGVGHLFPQLAELPGSWYRCVVAFNPSPLPLIGQIDSYWWIFSGFTSPMVFVPPLARRFAHYLRSRQDGIIELCQNYLHSFGGGKEMRI